MLSGTGQSGTRDPGPGTHWVPENIAIQSGTRDLGPRVPESIVVPKNDPLLKNLFPDIETGHT